MNCVKCGRALYRLAYKLGDSYIGPKCFVKEFGGLPAKTSTWVKRVNLNQQRPVNTDTLTLPLFEEGEM